MRTVLLLVSITLVSACTNTPNRSSAVKTVDDVVPLKLGAVGTHPIDWGTFLTAQELLDFRVASRAISLSLGVEQKTDQAAPLLYGMTIRQIVLFGLTLEQMDRKLTIGVFEGFPAAERKEFEAQLQRDRGLVAALTIRIAHWKRKEPNKAPEPTALLVTPHADACGAPSRAVAHL